MEIVIFGASGGIGQVLVRHLKKDHSLYGTYLQHDTGSLEAGCEYGRVDVCSGKDISTFISGVSPRLAYPVLIYTAGISINNPVHKYRDEDWGKILAINLTGAMYACREILPRMREVGFGRIILISSVLSRFAVPGTIAYSATKSALCAMARVMAVENASKGITVNALALGYHDVGIIKNVPESYLQNQVLPGIPQGRLGDPMNIIHAISFLMQADYVTGATIDINGGMA